MINLYNEDCLAGMTKIPDGSVDLILTDLPYGCTDCDFDRRIPFEPMWQEFWRVTKLNAAIVLFSQMPFGSDLIQSQRKLFRYEWIWEKSCGAGFLNVRRLPLRCHENILIFYRKSPVYNPQFTKGKPRFTGGYNDRQQVYQKHKTVTGYNDGEHYYPRDVLYFKSIIGAEERFHPTQKPVDLLEYLIRTYTNEGEVVLDATMGSGSTGVAAVNTGRNFIGFETEEKFFNIAQNRISEALAKKQQELF